MIVIEVMDMVEEYLMTNGYDGLVERDGECSCLLSDLAPCGEMQASCKAGHRVECDPNAEEEDRPPNCEGDCRFHIRPGKRPGGGKGYTLNRHIQVVYTTSKEPSDEWTHFKEASE